MVDSWSVVQDLGAVPKSDNRHYILLLASVQFSSDQDVISRLPCPSYLICIIYFITDKGEVFVATFLKERAALGEYRTADKRIRFV